MIPVSYTWSAGFEDTTAEFEIIDSLLLNSSFDQAKEHILDSSFDQFTEKKYIRLCNELAYLTKFNEAELVDICMSATLYRDRFTFEYSGDRATHYYQIYEYYYAAQKYSDAVTAYNLANFYQSTFIHDIFEKTRGKIDSAEVFFNNGDVEGAIDLISRQKDNIYRYNLLKDYRWEYEAKQNKYKKALKSSNNEESLLDTIFIVSYKNVVSVHSNMIINSKPFSDLKPISISHSTMKSFRQTKYLENFKSTGGVSIGLSYDRYMTQRIFLSSRFEGGKIYYTGKNDSTGLNTGLSTKHLSLAIGAGIQSSAIGRINYYTSIYLSHSETEVERTITYRHPYIEHEYLFISPNRGNDDHIEINIGVLYYPISNKNLILKTSTQFVHTLDAPSFFGPQFIALTFSIGTYF